METSVFLTPQYTRHFNSIRELFVNFNVEMCLITNTSKLCVACSIRMFDWAPLLQRRFKFILQSLMIACSNVFTVRNDECIRRCLLFFSQKWRISYFRKILLNVTTTPSETVKFQY